MLFCGSVYVLLGTNLGARLGFLVAFTGAHRLPVILSPAVDHHRVAAQHAQGPHPAVEGAARSSLDLDEGEDRRRCHDIKQKQNNADATEAANVKAAVDAALVTKVSTPTVEYTPNDNRFAKFDDVTKYMILQT